MAAAVVLVDQVVLMLNLELVDLEVLAVPCIHHEMNYLSSYLDEAWIRQDDSVHCRRPVVVAAAAAQQEWLSCAPDPERPPRRTAPRERLRPPPLWKRSPGTASALSLTSPQVRYSARAYSPRGAHPTPKAVADHLPSDAQRRPRRTVPQAVGTLPQAAGRPRLSRTRPPPPPKLDLSPS